MSSSTGPSRMQLELRISAAVPANTFDLFFSLSWPRTQAAHNMPAHSVHKAQLETHIRSKFFYFIVVSSDLLLLPPFVSHKTDSTAAAVAAFLSHHLEQYETAAKVEVFCCILANSSSLVRHIPTLFSPIIIFLVGGISFMELFLFRHLGWKSIERVVSIRTRTCSRVYDRHQKYGMWRVICWQILPSSVATQQCALYWQEAALEGNMSMNAFRVAMNCAPPCENGCHWLFITKLFVELCSGLTVALGCVSKDWSLYVEQRAIWAHFLAYTSYQTVHSSYFSCVFCISSHTIH